MTIIQATFGGNLRRTGGGFPWYGVGFGRGRRRSLDDRFQNGENDQAGQQQEQNSRPCQALDFLRQSKWRLPEKDDGSHDQHDYGGHVTGSRAESYAPAPAPNDKHRQLPRALDTTIFLSGRGLCRWLPRLDRPAGERLNSQAGPIIRQMEFSKGFVPER